DALLDLVGHRQPHFVTWMWNDEAKECRAAIRALPADRRASLFRHLLAIKTYLGWDGELEIYRDGTFGAPVFGPEGDVHRFEKFCEGVMMALCETGFPIDAELATRTVDWLAHHCPQGYGLKNVANRSYAKIKLGAVKAIAEAAAKGMAL